MTNIIERLVNGCTKEIVGPRKMFIAETIKSVGSMREFFVDVKKLVAEREKYIIIIATTRRKDVLLNSFVYDNSARVIVICQNEAYLRCI